VRVDVEKREQSAVEALWALGAPKPKNWLKRPRRAGCALVERVPKNSAQSCRFLPPITTGTVTIGVNYIGKEIIQATSTVMSHGKGKVQSSCSLELVLDFVQIEVELPDVEVHRTEELCSPFFPS
jgi:hypothetical protein